MQCLKRAIAYQQNAVVRVEAVEALESSPAAEALPWIRSGLLDEHPGVRFAACVAIGVLRDRGAEIGVRLRLDDENASVRVASLFALHRLGHQERTGEMAAYLLDHEDVTVRRNAALVLGLLGESTPPSPPWQGGVGGVVKLLARAMKDPDEGVRHHALEAMARLGNPEAKQELTFMTNSGVGSQEVFAIQALAALEDPRYHDTFRYKLETGAHLETKLAAALGLGLLRSEQGFNVALLALRRAKARTGDPNDPPEGQLIRIRQLAAAALGAMGRLRALPSLAGLLDDSVDPRLQVSAARAILQIYRANRKQRAPFAMLGERQSR